jgi:hypothetical protein
MRWIRGINGRNGREKPFYKKVFPVPLSKKFYKNLVDGSRPTLRDKVFGQAFCKKLAGCWARSPTKGLFFFHSFFLWPTYAKKKAGKGYM